MQYDMKPVKDFGRGGYQRTGVNDPPVSTTSTTSSKCRCYCSMVFTNFGDVLIMNRTITLFGMYCSKTKKTKQTESERISALQSPLRSNWVVPSIPVAGIGWISMYHDQLAELSLRGRSHQYRANITPLLTPEFSIEPRLRI